MTGIDSASSMYACIWCKCPSHDRWDGTREWSISSPEKGARTIKESVDLANLPKSKTKFNVSNPPLFPNIPLQRVVIDNLHLFLRIADVIIDLLIEELMRQDTFEKNKKITRRDR